MKKGILSRLLVIVLVCAMLFGLMGFTTIKPQDGEDGVQNEEVTEQTNDNEPVGEPEGEEPSEEPGEEPSEEPGDEPGEKPGDVPGDEPQNPELIKISIASVKGGTLALDMAKLPEGAEVEEGGSAVYAAEGTKLDFVATAAKEGVVSSEFVAAYVDDETDEAGPVKVKDCTEADGGYKFSITTGKNPITVSAEFFGIKSVEVSNADVWVNASNKDCGKIVTVNTFGAKNVVLSADGATITATDKGNGVFTALVAAKDYQLDENGKDFTVAIYNDELGLKNDTKVTINKIDTIKPEVSFVSKQEKKEGRKTWSYVTWKITEAGSGVVNKFNFERKLFDGRVSAGTANDTYKYDPNTGLLTFTVLAINYNNLVVTFHDVAGNETEANSPVKPYVEIVGVSIGQFDETTGAWWAGAESELLFNSDKEDAMVFVGDKSVDVNKKSIETDEDGVRQYSANISKSGKYTVKSEDENASDTAVIKYDPNAPVVSDVKFVENAYDGDNWLKFTLNKITHGWLFNNGFRFEFHAEDAEDSKSGLYAYAYKLVAEDEDAPSAPSIRKLKEGTDNSGWKLATPDDNGNIKVSETGEFTGYVYLCVWDNAENAKVVKVGVNGENEAIITNIATQNDVDTPRDSVDFNPTLTVKATSDGKAYFYKNSKDEDNWVRSVNFDISAYLGELPESDETKTYEFGTPTITVIKLNNESDIPCTVDGSKVTAKYTESSNYDGVIEFKVTCPIKETVTVDGVAQEPTTFKTVEAITKVSVNVQSNIDSASVLINGKSVDNNFVSDWFNSKDNILSSKDGVVLKEPVSNAPFTTYYKLTYTPVGGTTETIVEKTIDNDFNGKINLSEEITKDGIYVLTAKTIDCLGNTNESQPAVTIKYDINPAAISVQFTQAEKYSSDHNEYFDIRRNAKVFITDESFDGTETIETLVGNETSTSENDNIKLIITQSFGANAKEGKWYFIADKTNGGGQWINDSISYGVESGEAKDGDHYKMTVSVVDNAGNESRTDDMGNYYTFGSEDAETGGAYSGLQATNFTIDQTKPVVSVSFDNNNVRNGMYFNAGRTATITVVEHTFDAARVKMAAVNATAGADPHTGWVQSKDNKDIWTKTVTFNPQDATCEFNIEVTDLAGNVCRNTGVNYGNSAAHDKFVIDQVNPTLGVTGTNQTPYSDACTPGFTGNDTNISDGQNNAEYTVQLTRTVREHKNQDVTNLFANVNPNMGKDLISAVYANIPDDAENDGIYTLNVSVTDLAGNSSQTSNTFTVNRHGSFYVFNDDLAKLVNDKFVQKADGKYSITEYNASPLVAGSVKIEIYRDGQLEKTIKPTVGAAVLGASGLYEYTYDLPAENFAQDGRYSVSVSSEDEAKNMSDNTKLEESILEFTVDSVNPEIVIIKGLEKAIVNAEELEFTVNAIDTYGIKSIQIIVDGEVVKTFVPQEVYDQLKAEGKAMQQYEVMDENLDFTAAYTLYESSAKQSIEIVVTDMAGNSFTTASKDFAPVYDFHDSILVSTSFFARYIHNPLALVGTGIVIAGAVWLVIAKKKKTEEAAA